MWSYRFGKCLHEAEGWCPQARTDSTSALCQHQRNSPGFTWKLSKTVHENTCNSHGSFYRKTHSRSGEAGGKMPDFSLCFSLLQQPPPPRSSLSFCHTPYSKNVFQWVLQLCNREINGGRVKYTPLLLLNLFLQRKATVAELHAGSSKPGPQCLYDIILLRSHRNEWDVQGGTFTHAK